MFFYALSQCCRALLRPLTKAARFGSVTDGRSYPHTTAVYCEVKWHLGSQLLAKVA